MPARTHSGWILSLASVVAAACLLHLSAPVTARSGISADRYVTRLWNTASGLPDNSVHAIARTSDGYLWVGTPAGLARFDGVRFTAFGPGDASRMSEGSVLSLHEDGNGILWVGTAGGGLYAYTGDVRRRYGPGEGIVNGHVGALAGGRMHALWVGTDYGLHRMDGETTLYLGLDAGLADARVTALAVDPFGSLWVGTGWGGLGVFRDDLVRLYGPDDGLADPRVLSLCAGDDGVVWIGAMRGLYRLSPGDAMIRPVSGTERYPVTALAPGPGGTLFVGTMVEGLKLFDGSDLIDLLPGTDLGDSYVRAIHVADDATVWIGTDAEGLLRLSEGTVGAITTADGLPERSVYAILEDEDGTLWIGTEKSGLCEMRNGIITRVLDRSGGLAGDMVRALAMDRFGRLIVGTMDGGIGIIRNDHIEDPVRARARPAGPAAEVEPASGVDEGAIESVTSILSDRSGAMWIGTDRGLSRSADGRVEHIAPIEAFEGMTIRTLYEGAGGDIYVGTRSAAWRISGPSIARIRAENDSLTLDILSLHEDGDGALWLGTNGAGLIRLANGKASEMTTKDGLPGNFIYSITEDDAAHIWISCEAGVFDIARDSLAACAEGDPTVLSPTLYDEADGAPSARCNGFCQPAVCVSRSGERHYPTKEGIAVVPPVMENEPAQPPAVVIESMLAGEDAVSTDGEIELSHETDLVEFTFTALGCRAPEKCRFLYRLRGYDAAYTALLPGGERTARYRRLPPGEYEFAVRAVANGGVWSERPASVRFVIEPPFHRTGGFALILLGGVACAGGAAAGLARYRKRRRLRSKYGTSTISGERMERAIAGLGALMEEGIFLDPDLTLQKMARRLNIHPNHLSRIINENHGMSFNNFINRHRIAEARKRLADPALGETSILEIMYGVGFYSKSTFNAAFKKFAGTSPSEFRKKNR